MTNEDKLEYLVRDKKREKRLKKADKRRNKRLSRDQVFELKWN